MLPDQMLAAMTENERAVYHRHITEFQRTAPLTTDWPALKRHVALLVRAGMPVLKRDLFERFGTPARRPDAPGADPLQSSLPLERK